MKVKERSSYKRSKPGSISESLIASLVAPQWHSHTSIFVVRADPMAWYVTQLQSYRVGLRGLMSEG